MGLSRFLKPHSSAQQVALHHLACKWEVSVALEDAAVAAVEGSVTPGGYHGTLEHTEETLAVQLVGPLAVEDIEEALALEVVEGPVVAEVAGEALVVQLVGPLAVEDIEEAWALEGVEGPAVAEVAEEALAVQPVGPLAVQDIEEAWALEDVEGPVVAEELERLLVQDSASLGSELQPLSQLSTIAELLPLKR